MQAIYTASDNVIEVNSLTDALTGDVLAAATIEVTLTDRYDVNIAGQTFPLPLTPSATAGNYAGTLSKDLVLTRGVTVFAHITIDAGAGKVRSLRVPLEVRDDDGAGQS